MHESVLDISFMQNLNKSSANTDNSFCDCLWQNLRKCSTSGCWRVADIQLGTPPRPPASHSWPPAYCRRVWSCCGVLPADCHLESPRCSQRMRQFSGSRWDHGGGLWKPHPHHGWKYSQTGWLHLSERCRPPLESYLRDCIWMIRKNYVLVCCWLKHEDRWSCTSEHVSTCDKEDSVVSAEGAVLPTLAFPVDHDFHDLCPQRDVGGIEGHTGGRAIACLIILAWDKERRQMEVVWDYVFLLCPVHIQTYM